MATEVIMPSLGMTMEEGTIISWLKKEGEKVEKDEPLLEVMTDKVNMEVESPASGVLLKILAGPDEVIPVGNIIGWIGKEGEEIPEAEAAGEKPKEEPQAEPEAVVTVKAETPAVPGKVKASPAARRIARENGIDLSTVAGTGPGGRIVSDDVRAALEKQLQPAAPGPASEPKLIKLAGLRRTISERMMKSKREAAHVTINVSVDASQMAAAYRKLKTGDEKVTYTDLLALAVSRVLKRHPELNGRVTDEGAMLYPQVNLGLAVAVEAGLVVPVIKNAQAKGIVELARDRKVLIEKAKAGRLENGDLSGGTFTITNLGMYGIDDFTPIINYPEIAILGVGSIKETPVARDGEVVVRPVLRLSLSFDHRIVDGAPAAAFLADLRDALECPFLMS